MANFYRDTPSTIVGRPASQSTKDFVEYVIRFLQNNKSECQFSINQIKEDFTNDKDYKFPDITTIKNKLYDYYSNEIVCHTYNKDIIILYKTNITKELAEDWYEKRFQNKAEENLRIVEMAAKICLEEIRSSYYINDHYEVPDLTKENMFNGVSKTLKAFLEIVIKTHKEKYENNQVKYDKKIATLAHCIISSTRPRSFTSPILVGLSSMIHKKYASKGLIDSLSNVGLIASYKEVLKFEASIINDPANHTLTEDAYIQFVYDNADHNTCTIDGRNTFHAMGGIMIATPSSSVVSKVLKN
ncbi:hypothetical protein ALC57_05221 [Trachymyrmex cornetzi]|uniref:Uncharacterized protein n=1 Tax=Trachymyrmex cornetzi TaxID=471704 RepID=A0A151JBK7_9HYME|nr:hypothetical protein ALC57_05221 [Trachymyrmex cornetzi]